MSSISLNNIVKKYESDVLAVDHFNLEIEDKEFLILVGPSGCGKSTVLRMIAGLEEITEGQLFIGSRQVDSMAAKERNIAMVFQNYALYPHMNVYKNMAFGLKMRKMKKDKIREKILAVAEQLRIEELLYRKPSQLSGGQRQRVALGRAMVREPEVFLLDEPLSNLDAKLRTEMRVQISRLHKQLQTTFVYVTHDQTEAMTMADRIVVMKDGVIQQIDPPKGIYQNPRNLFVAGFIGSPRMNFIPARVIGRADGQIRLSLLDKTFAVESDRFPSLGTEEEVIAGIRPEEVHLDREERGDWYLGRAEVLLKEDLGPESCIYLSCLGCELTAKAPGTEADRINTEAEVFLNADRLHLFSARNGMSLRMGD